PNRGTGHDLVKWKAADWAPWMPPGEAKKGQTWAVKGPSVDRLMGLLYPPLTHWRAEDGKLRKSDAKATGTDVADGAARREIEAPVDLDHPSVGRPTDGRTHARLVGLARVRPEGKEMTSFLLVSERATYTTWWNGKAIVRPLRVAIAGP